MTHYIMSRFSQVLSLVADTFQTCCWSPVKYKLVTWKCMLIMRLSSVSHTEIIKCVLTAMRSTILSIHPIQGQRVGAGRGCRSCPAHYNRQPIKYNIGAINSCPFTFTPSTPGMRLNRWPRHMWVQYLWLSLGDFRKHVGFYVLSALPYSLVSFVAVLQLRSTLLAPAENNTNEIREARAAVWGLRRAHASACAQARGEKNSLHAGIGGDAQGPILKGRLARRPIIDCPERCFWDCILQFFSKSTQTLYQKAAPVW